MSEHLLRAQTRLVNDVRKTLFQALPITSEQQYLIRDGFDELRRVPLEHILRLAGIYKGGFNQELTAQVLARIYGRLGFESAVLRVGSHGSGFVHTLTLVALSDGGRPVISIQDAYYNFSIETSESLASDYRDVIRALTSKDFATHQMTSERDLKQTFVSDARGDRYLQTQIWYWGDPLWMKWLQEQTGLGLLINALLFPIDLLEIEEESPAIAECLRNAVPLLPDLNRGSIFRRAAAPSPRPPLKEWTDELVGAAAIEADRLLGPASGFSIFRSSALAHASYSDRQSMVVDLSSRPKEEAISAIELFFRSPAGFQPMRFMAIGRMSPEIQETLAAELAEFPKETVREAFSDDPWLRNYFLNWWQYSRGETTLETYPWNISLPIADICNARCTFCTSWLEGKELISLEQVDAFEPVIRMAHQFGLAGHGEPLVHPKLKELLKRFARFLDPRAASYLITNGIHLEENIGDLLDARVRDFNISLNAASAEVHDQVMGLGPQGFDRVIAGIRALRQMLQDGKLDCKINITLVITAQNVHQLADFIRLGVDLGVSGVMLRSLAGQSGLPMGLNYHTLPPYLHPDFETHVQHALAAIERYKDVIDIKADPAGWGVPIFPPEIEKRIAISPPPLVARTGAAGNKQVREFYRDQSKFKAITKGGLAAHRVASGEDDSNPFGRQARFSCRAPYQFLYINDFAFNMSPCCYMSYVPGHEDVIFDGSYDFMEAWNSTAMVKLRERLRAGLCFICASAALRSIERMQMLVSQ